ncbi:exodeoxyribonuclease VII large subunit [Tindallia californiensis]|uniref:Exodeoxyribonuclease 7 large subunit n=1 Tax=Tindallia californiensis TaxID=159292 RepID=A0A1H3NKE9_9FIRM|nr:exodeoxyribonuclease VII large subunit [Tindallia californiensis]SDY89150.1 Exodeoxyribonuclease VII large subunit [Tindallia californiensis]
MRIKTLSVSDVNKYIKKLFNADPIMHRVSVVGEVTGFKAHSSGHYYFTLKDETSRLRCVMFQQNTKHLTINIKEGMKLKVNGGISVYERDGQYQLYAEHIEEAGIGDYYRTFQQSKERLEKQGLFRKDRKKKLPLFPKKIGVITSPSGAALQDILKVIKRRWPVANIYLFSTQVQGELASKSLVRSVKLAQNYDLDVVLLGRGGGAVEELWAFNDEELAYIIAESKIPVITGIGHETDSTIADFVADYHAHTPTAAAEIAVPDITEICSKIDQQITSARKNCERLLHNHKIELMAIRQRIPFRFPERLIESDQKTLEHIRKRLMRAPMEKIKRDYLILDSIGNKIDHLSPLSVMKRGYGIIQKPDGKVVTDIHQMNINDTFHVKLKNGELIANVLKKKEGEIDS